MFPTSVEPRVKAKRMSLHPPRLNSLELEPVPPIWRISTGLAEARPARAAMRIDSVYMVLVVVVVLGASLESLIAVVQVEVV